MKRWWVWMVMLAAVLGACGGVDSESTTGSGGGGGSTTSDGGGTTAASTTSIGTVVSTTTTVPPPVCGLPEPEGCSYPEPFKGYYPGAVQSGALGPASGEDGTTASASCFDPLPADVTFTRAVVGFNEEPPAELLIDAWTQEGTDPGDRLPAPQLAVLESTEDGPDSLTSGVYVLASPVSGEGLVPCMGTMVGDYRPPTMLPADACYQPARTWWYGLPKLGDGVWTWSMLDCPEDESILSYRRELPYELRP